MEFSRDGFEVLAQDLLHLEITLVAHPFIDRSKVPDPATQLKDIAQNYKQETGRVKAFFGELASSVPGEGTELFRAAVSMAAAPQEKSMEIEQPGDLQSTFAGIEKDARDNLQIIQMLKSIPDMPLFDKTSSAKLSFQSTLAMEEGVSDADTYSSLIKTMDQRLSLIQDNTKHINAMIGELKEQSGDSQELQWEPKYIMETRKYWEVLPQDEILMRTVIGMDGDVITHINPTYAFPEFAHLHKLHDQSVSVSVGFWKELVGILYDFVTLVVDKLFFR